MPFFPTPRLWLTISALTLLLDLSLSQSCDVGFEPYPECAREYLCNVVPTDCLNLGTASNTDECLCTSTTFLTNSALSIYANCGCDILSRTATLIASICSEYAPDAPVSAQDYIAGGNGGQSACTSFSTTTASPTSTSETVLSSVSATTPPSEPETSPASQPQLPTSVNGPTTFVTSSIPSATVAATSGAGGGGGDGGNSGLSGSALAGITIGGFVVTTIGVLIAFDKWLEKKRHKRLFEVCCGRRT
jgi:hypothetical protein